MVCNKAYEKRNNYRSVDGIKNITDSMEYEDEYDEAYSGDYVYVETENFCGYIPDYQSEMMADENIAGGNSSWGSSMSIEEADEWYSQQSWCSEAEVEEMAAISLELEAEREELERAYQEAEAAGAF